MLIKVYLAGGMKSGWQDEVKLCFNQGLGWEFEFFDPRDNDTRLSKEYTPLDLFRIRKSDIVFGFMEEDNPSGIGLAAELVYAKDHGKVVILVNEIIENRYWAFVHQIVDVVYPNLHDGIDFLKKFSNKI